MFKKFFIMIFFIMAMFIFSSCSDVDDASDIPNFGAEIRSVTDWSQVVDYDGMPVSLEISLNNVVDEADYGVILFVDGVRERFTTNEHNQLDFMHIFHLKAEEHERAIIVTFSPSFVAQGDIAVVDIALILNPIFAPKSLDLPTNRMEHMLLSITPYRVSVNAASEKKVEISEIISGEKAIPDELENEFIIEGEFGLINELYNKSQFRIYQNSLYAPEDYYTAQKGEDLKLELACFGKPEEYRISLYINNEIIPAFDGKEYFDVNIERDKLKTKDVIIPASELENLGEFSHVYFIAVPIEQGEVVILIKNKTRILHIV